MWWWGHGATGTCPQCWPRGVLPRKGCWGKQAFLSLLHLRYQQLGSSFSLSRFVRCPWLLNSWRECLCQSSSFGKDSGISERSMWLPLKNIFALIFIQRCQTNPGHFPQVDSTVMDLKSHARMQMHLGASLTWIIYWRQKCWLWVPEISWLTVPLFLDSPGTQPQAHQSTQVWRMLSGSLRTCCSSKSFININGDDDAWSRAFTLPVSSSVLQFRSRTDFHEVVMAYQVLRGAQDGIPKSYTHLLIHW